MKYINNVGSKYEKYIKDLTSSSIDHSERETLRQFVNENEDLFETWTRWKQTLGNYEKVNELLNDPEMAQLAQVESDELLGELSELEAQMKVAILKPDEDDRASAILEVRAGTGGDEAALFTFELFSMYQNYAQNNSWNFETITIAQDGPGSLREGIAKIDGLDVFGKLKWESGVHRVQRIPQTESQGRIHTSTVTVAIMPKHADSKLVIPDKDIRVDVYRSSGAGGQNANKTNSAVRVVHIPTGMMVCIEEERNQQQNRCRAMTILQARLQERRRRELESERQKTRQAQIGHAERSEKIRTYNFPQGRITDHRINHSIYCINDFMREARGLDQLIDRLKLQNEASTLEEIENITE